MDKITQHDYKRLREKGWTANHAYHVASVNCALRKAGNVRLRIEDDFHFELDWDVSAKERQEIEDNMEDGYWHAEGFVLESGNDVDGWEYVDSCWGFLGTHEENRDVMVLHLTIQQINEANNATKPYILINAVEYGEEDTRTLWTVYIVTGRCDLVGYRGEYDLMQEDTGYNDYHQLELNEATDVAVYLAGLFNLPVKLGQEAWGVAEDYDDLGKPRMIKHMKQIETRILGMGKPRQTNTGLR